MALDLLSRQGPAGRRGGAPRHRYPGGRP